MILINKKNPSNIQKFSKKMSFSGFYSRIARNYEKTNESLHFKYLINYFPDTGAFMMILMIAIPLLNGIFLINFSLRKPVIIHASIQIILLLLLISCEYNV